MIDGIRRNLILFHPQLPLTVTHVLILVSIFQNMNLYAHRHIHMDMGSKTISVSDEAYARLKARKKPGESFSDTINRLTMRKRLSELAGVLDDDDIRVIEKAVTAIRSQSKERIRELVAEISE
ncbi:MAG: antitoxin VapB family protein [Candidatus Thorarchaeota archaeon]